MSIPYRTQQNIKRLAITLLILLVAGSLLWGMWILWLQRFVVYTREDGAVIDFNVSQTLAPGQEALPPEEGTQIEVYYNEGDGKVNISKELTQLKGYYVTAADLSSDIDAVRQLVEKQPPNTPVMLDVKSIYGTFFYTTGTGRPLSDSVAISAVDSLIADLKNDGYYTIAKIPALRDREYGLEHTSSGLPIEGGYLWMDEEGCYWLDPTKENTLNYLLNIATELREMGFDEVVFDEFRFPETESIVFEGDKAQILADAAQMLVDGCANNNFTVSFICDGSWQNPNGRTRVYRTDVASPTELMSAVPEIPVADPVVNMVFLTNNMDVRFDEYSVLRPINLAG